MRECLSLAALERDLELVQSRFFSFFVCDWAARQTAKVTGEEDGVTP